MVKQYDIAIIGAGASGLMAACTALRRGKSVVVLEMGNLPARKLAVSGGGNCNITNTDANYTRYFGKNPEFVRGALARFSPYSILDWAEKHKIKLYEKTSGRYFCSDGANVVVDALMKDAKDATFMWNEKVLDITRDNDLFLIQSDTTIVYAKSVIIATGGVSFPTLGVSETGYKIAKKFGHKIIPVCPGLCGLVIAKAVSDFAGISVNAQIQIGKYKINDDLLFTHFGLGGPLAYRTSMYDLNDGFTINLKPNLNIYEILKNTKRTDGRKKIASVLSEYIPTRIAKYIVKNSVQNIADIKDDDLRKIADNVQNIYISGTDIKRHGLSSAEVVRGGISTDEISSKTMESKLCKGLFFAGEAIDIAGDLGGFNLQWAWASGFVAGSNA